MEREGNGCFGPSMVGVVFQQTACMTVTNRDGGLGVRD